MEREHSQVRQALLDAALCLFLQHDFDKVSTRQIAQQAGCNIGMIRYYFNNKLGLFEAVLRGYTDKMIAQMDRLGRDLEQASLGRLLELYYEVVAPHPDYPKLVVRIMSMPESSQQKKLLTSLVVNIPMPLERLIELLKAKGALRQDLDPAMTRLSLMSLMIFPFLVPASLLRLQGIELDTDFIYRLSKHNQELLSHGFSPLT